VAYRRGYTPYLADFVVVALLETFFKLFFVGAFSRACVVSLLLHVCFVGDVGKYPPLPFFPFLFLFAFVLV
jgi:hypothetical protein